MIKNKPGLSLTGQAGFGESTNLIECMNTSSLAAGQGMVMVPYND